MTNEAQVRGDLSPTEIKELICKETAQRVSLSFRNRLGSIVLTGSLARDEATFVKRHAGYVVLGDAEFLLVFRDRSQLPDARTVTSVCSEIDQALLRFGVRCTIDLSPVYQRFFRRLQPHIFGYELKTCGQVIWGDPTIFSLARQFEIADIPLEDAWRTVCNRLIELLDAAHALTPARIETSQEVKYKCVKLYLDMATSLLLFLHDYAPSYKERERRLLYRADTSRTEGTEWPFSPSQFARNVSVCTRSKLSGDMLDNVSGWMLFESAIDHAHTLWRWELTKLTASGTDTPDSTLLERWMRLQRPRDRVLGWLFALREGRSRRMWPRYPRWARLAWIASPRYCVYRAASDLAFQLPTLLTGEDECVSDTRWNNMRQWLPEVLTSSGPRGWREVAGEIVRNYNLYLTRTRA